MSHQGAAPVSDLATGRTTWAIGYMQVENVQPTVVFVFGGPGTQKGKYIDRLVDLYGFHCLTICRVLEQELGETRVYEMRTSDMAEITINTVMQWFVARIGRRKNAPGFIVDIVPNIKVPLFLCQCH